MRKTAVLTAAVIGIAASMPARAELSTEELAKLAQNPVGNLISVPFQNNTNLNFGPEKGTQNILNIQPVIPISVDKDWNIITRTILPVVWQPALSPSDSSVSGISDLQFTAFLSPANPGAISGLLDLLLGAYAIGLGRAWELMGAPRSGVIFGLIDLLIGRLDRTRKQKPAAKEPPSAS